MTAHLPRIERFEEECWFVLPALAFSMKDGFAIATGWLKWHIEIKWPNDGTELPERQPKAIIPK